MVRNFSQIMLQLEYFYVPLSFQMMASKALSGY